MTEQPKGYGETHAPSYDRLFGDRDDVEQVAEFLHELAGGCEAIEFGVGTGRFALPLARRGTRVHAVDNSPSMLAILREKSERALADGADAVPIEPITGDMTSVRIDAEAGLVFCVFSTLFLLEDQDAQLAVLQNAARHLEPGGKLVLECFVHDRTRFPDNQEVRALEVDDGQATFRLATLEPNAQVIRIQKILLSGERPAEFIPNCLRFIYPSELELMGRLTGFRTVARYGGWDRRAFTPTSNDLVQVFERVDAG